MTDNKRLSVSEFLNDIRYVIASPGRRFSMIHDRDVLWGSLLLLILPAYFPFSFAGGIYFRRDPFPGYSFVVPLVLAVVLTVLKLFSIHIVARTFEGRGRISTGRGSFRELLVVFGYTGIPQILAMLLALTLFLLVPEALGRLIHQWHVLAISLMVAVGVALFVWNVILMVLALRTVYVIRDFKIVISLFVGPIILGVLPPLSAPWIVSEGKVDFACMRPIVSPRVVAFVGTELPAQGQKPNKISVHVDRLSYRRGAPERFDLVTYAPAQSQNRAAGGSLLASGVSAGDRNDLLAARIVGVPGDSISLPGGKLVINGQCWAEPYIGPEFRSTESLPSTKLGSSEYFVLPEDRRLIDSFRPNMIVHRERIFGRLAITRWPLGWWLFRPTVFLQPYPIG